MVGLGQEDEIEEITLRVEIWWHDTCQFTMKLIGHFKEMDTLIKCSQFSDLGRPRVLSFSERIVITSV